MNFKDRIKALEPELISLRRDFHRHPELGFQEFRTQEKIICFLKELGLSPEKTAGTGVTTLIQGARPGPAVLLRADMDALPVQENTGLDFASQTPGVMHACGHDGHMAMLLVAARVLTEIRDHINGSIRLVFQPNEEEAGAYKVIEEGVMAEPEVTAAFGLHLWSQVPSGCVDIVTGPQMAASHYFYLTIKGRGGHAGFAHESVDPIYAATQVIQGVQAIQTRETDALNPLVIMFTQFHAGSNMTIIPETVEIKGSIRFLYEGGEKALDRFKNLVALLCQAHQVDHDLRFETGNALLANDPSITGKIRQAAGKVLQDPSKVTANIRTMAGEDFSDYLQHAPGAFAFLGSCNPDAGSHYPHHHPMFTIDEGVLGSGAELYVCAALELLR
jgi:amidohydrolase